MSTKKIVFTGAESSGKSFSSRLLAHDKNVCYIEEVARSFLKTKKLNYTYTDILEIGKLQMEAELVAIKKDKVIICDTDLLTIKVWLAFLSLEVPSWIVEHLQYNPASMYLLMYPNIPWVADELRQNPNERLALFEVYKKEIVSLGVPFEIINGKKEIREIQINKAIQSFMPQSF